MNETIEQLQKNYNTALDALRATPQFAAKELAGEALQAAHVALKTERLAAKIAANTARLTNTVPAAPSVETGDSNPSGGE